MSAQDDRRHLRIDRDGHVLRITIDRPDVLNALHPAAHLEMSEALDLFERDEDLRLCVLTGAGDRAFSVGRDLKQWVAMSNATSAERDAETATVTRTRRLTERFDVPKPIIARVNGLALGGGLELALACDIIIAAEHAEFGLPEVRRGLIAGGGGVHRLPRQLGLKPAMGYMLSGRQMSAQRAYELGLVNEVAPRGALDEVVDGWIADILKGAPLAIQATKESVLQGLDMPLETAMRAEYSAERRREQSSDAIEGIQAFAERRMPQWQCR